MFKYAFASIAFVLALFIGGQARAATPMQNGYFVNLNTVKFIQCVTTDGDHFAGSAFIIGKNRVVTADHVIHAAQSCTIDHKKVTLVSHSPALDIAVLGVDLGEHPPILEISCDGFTLGETYFSLGFSKAQDFAMTKVLAQGSFDSMTGDSGEIEHLSEIRGLMFPGMSGGPIIDMDGRVVGLNNASDSDGHALSRSLSETSLCAALVAPDAPLYPMPPKHEISLDDLLKGMPGLHIVPLGPPLLLPPKK